QPGQEARRNGGAMGPRSSEGLPSEEPKEEIVSGRSYYRGADAAALGDEHPSSISRSRAPNAAEQLEETPGNQTLESADKDEALWNASDVAVYLKVSRSWVYHRAEAGLLPCLRVGALLRFEPASIRAYVRGAAARPGRLR